MVGGKLVQRTEKEYRALSRDSYSSLATFAKNRLGYYRRYVLGEKEEDEDDKAILIGNLVESLLPGMIGEFDKKFYLSICPSAPTGMMLDFVNALYKHTELNTKDGEVIADFEEIAKKAYSDSGYKLKFETVIEKFRGSDVELYYRQLRDTKPKGLQIVCQQDLENAERVVEELKNNTTTSWYINLVSDDRYIVYDQLQLEDFEIEELPMKMMVDRLIIDTQEKTIQPLDWKITWSVEGFVREYYLKRYTYLQAIIYHMGLMLTGKDLGIDKSEYTILPMKFIVADSGNYSDPLIYELTASDLQDTYNGFTYNGRYYPGLEEIIEELKWAKNNNKFRISKKNYLNGGVCHIQEQRK